MWKLGLNESAHLGHVSHLASFKHSRFSGTVGDFWGLGLNDFVIDFVIELFMIMIWRNRCQPPYGNTQKSIGTKCKLLFVSFNRSRTSRQYYVRPT